MIATRNVFHPDQCWLRRRLSDTSDCAIARDCRSTYRTTLSRDPDRNTSRSIVTGASPPGVGRLSQVGAITSGDHLMTQKYFGG